MTDELLGIIIVVVGIIIMTGFVFYDIGYKSGQIDAMSGIIKYELVKQPNGSTIWQHKQEESNHATQN